MGYGVLLINIFFSKVDGPVQQSVLWAAKVNPADCVAEYAAQNHGWVHSCAFNATGNILAYVGHDSTIYAVNAEQNPQEYVLSKSNSLSIHSFNIILMGHVQF